ncbi:hypothetical protein NSK_005876 [Nannochloropsis salina CCMP1776]|uniref:FAD-binding FR-type domain-containing protein n=1 Tax=Nannochloropsis salina CCMP1776 TaxID=1027361 RepID=A0A4D9CUB9_9STRA|nr:hypothetical protein NSK_005876 [Nannochloropsis salina CCMP1776]|eukprot:TFJ82800.1 hypothetical protein NSK_005876 [Nannochloropsis salina CCMP1776]
MTPTSTSTLFLLLLLPVLLHALTATNTAAFIRLHTTGALHGFHRCGHRRYLAAGTSGGGGKAKTPPSKKEEKGKEEPTWGRVQVLETKPAAEGLYHVSIDAGDLLASYSTPGQYVQLKPHAPGANPSFMAIASPPPGASGNGRAEFLIKKTEGTAWLCEARAGEEVDMTPAMGRGYQVQNFDQEGIKHVLLLAAGTGIAPIRAAIESDVLGLDKMSRYSRLYFGVRSPAYLPYTEKFPEWEARGVKIIPCFSRTPVPMNSPGYWGYVQQGLAGDEIRSPEKTAALLCGMKDMTNLSSHVLKEKGVSPERILFNF